MRSQGILIGALGGAFVVAAALLLSRAGPRLPATSGATGARTTPEAAPAPPTDRGVPPAAPSPLDGGTLVGRLVRGAPPRGVEGRVALATAGQPERTVEVAAGGFFRIPGLPRGATVDLAATSGDLPPARCQGLRIPAAGVLDIGDLPLGPGILLEVLVLGPLHAPVPGVGVTLRRGVENVSHRRDSFTTESLDLEESGPPPPEFRAATDAGGRARFPAVPPGTWTVEASCPGFETARAPVEIVEGALPPRPELQLWMGVALRGRLLAADGTAAAGVRLRFGIACWHPEGSWESVDAATGPDGEFRLEGLAPSLLDVWALLPGGRAVSLGMLHVPLPGPCLLRMERGEVLAGRVVDGSDGSPLSGAEVLAETPFGRGAFGCRQPLRARAVTGPDGGFRFEDLPVGAAFTLRVRRDGFAPHEETPLELPCEREIPLRRGCVLRGRALREDGAPVEGALVSAWPILVEDAEPFHQDQLGRESDRVRTGLDGTYRIDGLPPGKVMVIARATGLHQPGLPLNADKGHHPGTVPPSVKVAVSPEAETERNILLLPGATVAGVAVDPAGKPVAGLGVVVLSEARYEDGNMVDGPQMDGLAGPTAADGSFRVTGVLPGTRRFVILASPGGLRGRSRTFHIIEGTTVSDLRVEVAVPSGVVAGRVVRSDGTPAAGARVELDGPTEFPGGPMENWIPADARGEFRFEHLPPWTYRLYPQIDRFGFDEVPPVEIEPGTIREGITIVLQPRRAVVGVVLDRDGRPPPGAAVLVETAGEDETEPPEEFETSGFGQGPRIPLAVRSSAQADAEGRFREEAVGVGDLWVSAWAPGFLEGWVRVGAGAEAGGVEVRLDRGLSISGRVVDDATGSPAAGVPVSYEAPEGARVGAVPDSIRSGADGTFRLDGLPPGAYLLEFAHQWNEPDLEYEEVSREGVAAGTAGLEIRLKRSPGLAGRVLDQDGNPVAGVTLQLHLHADDSAPSGFGLRKLLSGKDGSFRFAGLKDGTYMISVGPAVTFADGPGDREVIGLRVPRLNPGRQDLEIRVQRGLPIRGVVYDAAGRPARDRGSCGEIEVFPAGEEEGELRIEKCFAGKGGRFTTGALLPGRTYDLHASGFADAWRGVARGVAPGATVEIRLEAGTVLAGRVVEEGGAAVPAGIAVELRGVDDGAAASGTCEFGRTGEGGTFRFAGLPEGRFRVRAGRYGSEFLPGESEDAVAAGATDVLVSLRRGVAIEGRLLDAGGKPVPDPRIEVEDESSDCAGNPDGTFRIPGLTPGKKVLLVECRLEGKWCRVPLGTFEAPASGLVLTLPAKPPVEEPGKDEPGGREGGR